MIGGKGKKRHYLCWFGCSGLMQRYLGLRVVAIAVLHDDSMWNVVIAAALAAVSR